MYEPVLFCKYLYNSVHDSESPVLLGLTVGSDGSYKHPCLVVFLGSDQAESKAPRTGAVQLQVYHVRLKHSYTLLLTDQSWHQHGLTFILSKPFLINEFSPAYLCTGTCTIKMISFSFPSLCMKLCRVTYRCKIEKNAIQLHCITKGESSSTCTYLIVFI